jgi:hypothetical protein
MVNAERARILNLHQRQVTGMSGLKRSEFLKENSAETPILLSEAGFKEFKLVQQHGLMKKFKIPSARSFNP